MPDIATVNAIALEALDEQLDRHDASVALGTRASVTDDDEEEGACLSSKNALGFESPR